MVSAHDEVAYGTHPGYVASLQTVWKCSGVTTEADTSKDNL